MQAGHDTPGAALVVLRELRRVEGEVDRAVVESVGRARAVGVTWDAIAGALGVTRPAVLQRFGSSGRPRAK